MASSAKYQVYGLDEVYPEFGQFSFKLVFNPKFFKDCQDFNVSLIDSSQKLMSFDVKKWGRKLNVDFTIDNSVAEGVSTVVVKKNNNDIGFLKFWIIKP